LVSILIIGSAAGVALKAIEKVDFMWYTKTITFFALLAYFWRSVVFYWRNLLSCVSSVWIVAVDDNPRSTVPFKRVLSHVSGVAYGEYLPVF
jgi:hypothetical protein